MARTEIALGTEYPHVWHYRRDRTGPDDYYRMRAAPFQICRFPDGRLILPISQASGQYIGTNTDNTAEAAAEWFTYNLAPGATTWTQHTSTAPNNGYSVIRGVANSEDVWRNLQWWWGWQSAIWAITPLDQNARFVAIVLHTAHRGNDDVASQLGRISTRYDPTTDTTNLSRVSDTYQLTGWGARSHHGSFHINTPVPARLDGTNDLENGAAMWWVFTRRSTGGLMAQNRRRQWHAELLGPPALDGDYAELRDVGWNFRNDWQHNGDGVTPAYPLPTSNPTVFNNNHYFVTQFQTPHGITSQASGSNYYDVIILRFVHMREQEESRPTRIEERTIYVGLWVDLDTGKTVFDCVWNGTGLFVIAIATLNAAEYIIHMVVTPGGDTVYLANLDGFDAPTATPGGVYPDDIRVGYHKTSDTYVIVAVTESTDSNNRPHVYWHTVTRNSDTDWDITEWEQVDTTSWGTDWPSSSIYVQKFIGGDAFHLGVARHSGTTPGTDPTDAVHTTAMYVYDRRLGNAPPTVGWVSSPSVQQADQPVTLQVVPNDADAGASIIKYRMLRTRFGTGQLALTVTERLSGAGWQTDSTAAFVTHSSTVGGATVPLTVAPAGSVAATEVPWIPVGTSGLLATLGGTTTLAFHDDYTWAAQNAQGHPTDRSHRYFFQVADNHDTPSEWATLNITPLGAPELTLTAPVPDTVYTDADVDLYATYTVTYDTDTIPAELSTVVSPQRRITLKDPSDNVIWTSGDVAVATTEISTSGYTYISPVGDHNTTLGDGEYTIEVRVSLTATLAVTATVNITITQPDLIPPIVLAATDPDEPAIAVSVVNLEPYEYATTEPVAANRYSLYKVDTGRSDYYYPSGVLAENATLAAGTATTVLDWATRAHSDYAYSATAARVTDSGTRQVAVPPTDFMVDLFRPATEAGPVTPAGRTRPLAERLNGAFWDASWLPSVWADQARTIPAVLGGPVAVLDDLSGNGNHLRFFPFLGVTPTLKTTTVPVSGEVRWFVEHNAGGYVHNFPTGPHAEIFLYYVGAASAALWAVADVAARPTSGALSVANIPTGTPPLSRSGGTTRSLGDYQYLGTSLASRARSTYLHKDGTSITVAAAGPYTNEARSYFEHFNHVVNLGGDITQFPVGWLTSVSLQDHTYTIGPYNFGQNLNLGTSGWAYRPPGENVGGDDPPIVWDWLHFGGIGWLNATLRSAATGTATGNFRSRFYKGLAVADTRDIAHEQPEYGGLVYNEVLWANLILSNTVTPHAQHKPPDFTIPVRIGDATYGSYI